MNIRIVSLITILFYYRKEIIFKNKTGLSVKYEIYIMFLYIINIVFKIEFEYILNILIMKKVAFHTPTLDVRGTNISVYDYAHFNEVLLFNKSIILVPMSSIDNCLNDLEAVLKFQKRFTVIFYTTKEDLENKLLSNDCDVLYCIKY